MSGTTDALAAPLRGAGVVLDAIRTGDVDALLAACRDPEATRFLNIPFPYERSHAESFVDDVVPAGWASGDDRTYAIRTEPGGALLGTISLRGRAPSGELGINVAPGARGRGLATRAAELLIARAFAAGFETLAWEYLVDNAASAALASRLGFGRTERLASCSTRPHLAGRPAERTTLHRMA